MTFLRRRNVGQLELIVPRTQDPEVRNRFKELDLIDRVPDELWTDVRDIV